MLKLFPKKPRKNIIENAKEETNRNIVKNKNVYASVNIINEANKKKNLNRGSSFYNKNNHFLSQKKNQNNNLLDFNMNIEKNDKNEKRASSPINEKSILSKKNNDFNVDDDINKNNFTNNGSGKLTLEQSHLINYFDDESEINITNNDFSRSNINSEIDIINESCRYNMPEDELNNSIDNNLFKLCMDINNKYIKNNNSQKLAYYYNSLLKEHNIIKVKYDRLLSQYMNFKNKNESFSDKKLSELNDKFNQLNNDYNIIVEENNKLKEERNKLREENNKLKEDNNELKNENLKLIQEIDEINQSANYLKDEDICLIILEYDNLKKQNQECLQENNELKKRLIDYEKEKSNKHKKVKIYKTPNGENNNYLNNENNNSTALLDELLKENNKIKMQNEQLNSDIYALKECYNKLNSDYNKLKEENKKLREESEIFRNQKIKSDYIFPIISLGSICSIPYMNSIIQCLVHISEFFYYFLNEYPKISLLLNQKNNEYITKGQLSEFFYPIINNIIKENESTKNLRNTHKNKKFVNPLSLENLKKVILFYKPQFYNKDSFNFKELILFLLQTMYEELNYTGNNMVEFNPNLNLLDEFSIFNNSNTKSNMNNLSIISELFYGIYEDTIKCNSCSTITYKYQKFELISFSLSNYENKIYNIYNGFEEMTKPAISIENNSFFCNICKKQNEAEYIRKIKEPPNKLLIIIDYNKVKPLKIEFDEIIDISKYDNHNFGIPIKYELICVCSNIYDSQNNNNDFITYCKNKENLKWYKFTDNNTLEYRIQDFNLGDPYLFLYEKL